jgi:hypothetical protein
MTVEIEHISQSALDTWKKCQQQGVFRYVMGLKIPSSMSMIQGKAFDKAESHNFAQKIKTQEDVKLTVVQDVLHESFQEETRLRDVIIENENIKPVEDEEDTPSYNEAESKALASLKVFHEDQAGKIIPTSSQRKFSISLNGFEKPYSLDGVIDLEAKTAEGFEGIIDLKLKAKSMSVDEANKSEQLTAYDAAVLAETGSHAKGVGLLATIKTKVPKVQFLSSSRTDEDTGRFLKGLGAVVRQVDLIKDGKLDPMPAPPGAWWCSKKFCGYWQFCKLRPKE